jgi:hypothetical protein
MRRGLTPPPEIMFAPPGISGLLERAMLSERRSMVAESVTVKEKTNATTRHDFVGLDAEERLGTAVSPRLTRASSLLTAPPYASPSFLLVLAIGHAPPGIRFPLFSATTGSRESPPEASVNTHKEQRRERG